MGAFPPLTPNTEAPYRIHRYGAFPMIPTGGWTKVRPPAGYVRVGRCPTAATTDADSRAATGSTPGPPQTPRFGPFLGLRRGGLLGTRPDFVGSYKGHDSVDEESRRCTVRGGVALVGGQ